MFDLRILVNGKPIKKYHDENGNLWVEAREGTEFEIELKNDTWCRMLGIVSVDGLNVINGKHLPISESNGYIIKSKDNIVIPGWKISSDEVREFVFTNKENSYSKKIGADLSNIGVIAAAFIQEKQPTWSYTWSWTDLPGKHSPWDTTPWYPTDPHYITVSSKVGSGVYTYSAVDPNPIAVGSGQIEDFKTHSVDFERGNQLGIVTIYYDSRENLIKKGIIKEDYGKKLPQPFIDNGDWCPNV